MITAICLLSFLALSLLMQVYIQNEHRFTWYKKEIEIKEKLNAIKIKGSCLDDNLSRGKSIRNMNSKKLK